MRSFDGIGKQLLKKSIWGIGPLAVFLIMAACQSGATPTEAPTATPEPPQATATAAPASTNAVTTTESTTSTVAVTSTSATTSTAPMTDTGAMTSTGTPTGTSGMKGDPEAGSYIVAISGGCGCHFNRDMGGLAGGNTFTVTEGVVHALNITPDEETGIGSWTPEQIATALTTGVDDENKQLHPVMPYQAFSALSQQEALDVAAYLLAQKPVANVVPEPELTQAPAPFTPAQAGPATAPTDLVARGQEIVTIAQCGSCHTPKNEDGSPKADMLLAGAPVRNEVSANITPDEETGLGKWTEDQIATYLRTGKEPDGKQAEGAMGQQIERRFSKLTEADAKAIAAYLKSIPAVKNEPKPAQ